MFSTKLENRTYSHSELVEYLLKDVLNVKRIGNRKFEYIVWNSYDGSCVANFTEPTIIKPEPISTGIFTLYFTLDKNANKSDISNTQKRIFQNKIGGMEEVLECVNRFGKEQPKYAHLDSKHKIFDDPDIGTCTISALQLFR
ncbi:MAG: hypothetical protein WC755_05035 [Candidatus Woesearchaeota archaeon]|jgi:hypothetical protein